MATRADIREAFFSELTSAAEGSHTVTKSDGSTYDITVDSDDITLRNPSTETLPQVIYNDNFRRVYYNEVGKGPDVVYYNEDGSVDSEAWREYIQAQFIIDVRASNEIEKEPIYESVHSAFGRYGQGAWPSTTLHDDVTAVEVVDSRSSDTGDEEDVIRGDQMEVRITFYREYDLSIDNLNQVNHAIEGTNYTTT